MGRKMKKILVAVFAAMLILQRLPVISVTADYEPTGGVAQIRTDE